MSIAIERQKCTGCGACREVCPGGLLYRDAEGKTYIRYPKDCWGCTSCVKECSFAAIQYYLGPDIGGRGGFLYTKHEKQLLHWIVVDERGHEEIITVDRNKANAY